MSGCVARTGRLLSGRRCIPTASRYSRCARMCVRRGLATAATAADGRVAGIADQIGQLTLLETAELVSQLRTNLKIVDLPSFAPAAAPAQAAPAEEEEAAPVAQEKTLFNLKLQSFDAGTKPKVIKEIKSLLGLSLVESKKFVESAPKMLKESVAKDECEKIIATLKAVGGEVVME